jgi:hypothetical protein
MWTIHCSKTSPPSPLLKKERGDMERGDKARENARGDMAMRTKAYLTKIKQTLSHKKNASFQGRFFYVTLRNPLYYLITSRNTIRYSLFTLHFSLFTFHSSLFTYHL